MSDTTREHDKPDRTDEPHDGIPTHAELTRQLRRLMTKGLPAVRPEDVAALLELHAIRTLALVDEMPSSRLAALNDRIRELIRGTRDETLRLLSPYAFGTYTTARYSLEIRLKQAAAKPEMNLGYESLRKTYLTDLATDFAERLLWLEERLRYNKWLERPYDEALHDETLRRYDFYTAMAFWVEASANDLTAALDDLRKKDERGFYGFACSGLWRWTKYLRAAYRYDQAFLGEWSVGKEVDLDETLRSQYDAEADPPLTPVDRSWLRVKLLETFHEELQPFIAAVNRTSGEGNDSFDRWMDWLRSCHCNLDEPDSDCSVHRFIRDAHVFYQKVNEIVSEHHRTDRAARFLTLPDIYEP